MDNAFRPETEHQTSRRYTIARRINQLFDGMALLSAMTVAGEAGFVNMEQLPETDGVNQAYCWTAATGIIALRIAAAAKHYRNRLVRNSVATSGFDPSRQGSGLDMLREMES